MLIWKTLVQLQMIRSHGIVLVHRTMNNVRLVEGLGPHAHVMMDVHGDVHVQKLLGLEMTVLRIQNLGGDLRRVREMDINLGSGRKLIALVMIRVRLNRNVLAGRQYVVMRHDQGTEHQLNQ